MVCLVMDSNVEISRRLIRGLIDNTVGVMWSGGKSSSVLWHMAYSEMDDCVPIFIDHGRHPIQTHDLIHKLFQQGNFKPQILRNDDMLSKINNGMIEGRPYTLRDPIVKKWLYDECLTNLSYDYAFVLSGDRITRDGEYLNFIDFMPAKGDGIKAVILRPLLLWSETDIWKYIKDNNVTVNERYAKGWRIVDYDDDWRPGDKPAWEYGTEYNESNEKMIAMMADINGLPR